MKRILIAALVLLAFPQAASAACPVGIANELSVVPPAELAEGQTQQHDFTVTSCTDLDRITVEWVHVKASNRPWMGKFDAANRETVVAEQLVPVASSYVEGQAKNVYTGSSAFTVPVGLIDGHYAVITRYYARGYVDAEAQGGSSFSIHTPDVCPNLDGKQQKVPDGLDRNCLPPVDKCPNLVDAQPEVPNGYSLVGGECKIIADPTGEDPVPLTPAPWITKVANMKVQTAGKTVRFTIRVGNRGPASLRNAVMCDRLPAGTSYVSHTGRGAAFANGSLCYRLGNLARGAARSFTVTVRIAAGYRGTAITNTACVTAANAAKKCAKAVVRVKRRNVEPVGGVTG